MELYEKALKLASEAHKDQKRKHDGSPYIVHPVMVARILSQNNFGENIVVAGLVHDVLEDSDFTKEYLLDNLNKEVAEIVTAVSEDMTLDWEVRKELYVKQVTEAGEPVWAVSVADKIHNAETFIEHHAIAGPDSWGVFNRGKEKKIWFEELLSTELSKVWKHSLLDIYGERIETLKSLAD